MKKIILIIPVFLFFGFVSPAVVWGQSGTLFQDGFTNGFSGWTKLELRNGTGQIDNGTARFEVPDGTRGGNAHVTQTITWPASRKLWYSCDIKVSDKNSTEAVVGGIYLLEATVTTGSWRDRGNIEITDSNAAAGFEPGQTLNDSTFILRMAYRGRDGGRDGHRQGEMVQAPSRNVWHRVQMLVDLSGNSPRYAWWLNGRFIWQDIDSSSGGDTAAPTEFHAGLTNVDWAVGNRGLVWVDNCAVSDTGPEPGASSSPFPTPTNLLTPTPSPPHKPGDLNGDGRVDILDLRQLLAGFSSIFDYNLVVGNFGK